MSELLLRVVDRVQDDPYLDARCTKRGDVIVICHDGHQWSARELASPEWVVVRVPDATPVDLCGFLAPEPEIDPHNPSMVIQRRVMYLDCDAMESLVGFRLDQENTPPITLTAEQVWSLRRFRPRRTDPNVFGGEGVEL